MLLSLPFSYPIPLPEDLHPGLLCGCLFDSWFIRIYSLPLSFLLSLSLKCQVYTEITQFLGISDSQWEIPGNLLLNCNTDFELQAFLFRKGRCRLLNVNKILVLQNIVYKSKQSVPLKNSIRYENKTESCITLFQLAFSFSNAVLKNYFTQTYPFPGHVKLTVVNCEIGKRVKFGISRACMSRHGNYEKYSAGYF